MNLKTLHRLVLLSSSILFLLASYVLLIISMNPAKGYELSIYSSTPPIFWITVIIGLIHGIVIMTLALYERIGKIWIIGLFETIFFNVLTISLYALRGYALYSGKGGDAAGYVGMAIDVSKYGGILDYNFYPITSILVSQIGQITNLSLIGISKYISSLFFVIYILSIYCLSKSIHDNKKFIFACMIASTPMLFPWFLSSMYHMLLSVLTLPMLFYFIIKSSDSRFRFFSIILIVILPLFHPITVIIVFIYLLATYMYDRYVYHESKILFPVLISFVSFVGWFISQYVIMRDTKLIISQIFHFFNTQSTASQVDYYVTKLGLYSAIKSFLYMDGYIVILFAISSVAIYYIIKNRKSEMILASIAVCFLVGNIFIITIFFTSKAHNPERLVNLNPNMILIQILIGYLIYKFLCEKQNMKTIFLVGLIMISSIMALFALYQSPIVTYPNDHMTNNDISSMDWLINNKNMNFGTIDIMGPVSRYADLIHGVNFRLKRDDLYRDFVLPSHFGIVNNDTFPIDKNRYLIITKYDVESYTDVWKDANIYNQQDFNNTKLFKNVDNIYDSKEVLFYLIRK